MAEHPNATVVRELYRAFEERDAATLGRLIREDAQWHVPGGSSLSGEYRGRGAIFAYFGKLAQLSGGTFHARLLDVLDGRAHAAALARATGTRGGREYVGTYLLLLRIEDGRIAEAHLFNEDQEAFDKFWA